VGRGARARTDGDAGSLSRMSSSETETLGVAKARRVFSSGSGVVVVVVGLLIVLTRSTVLTVTTTVVGLSLPSFSFPRWTRHDGERDLGLSARDQGVSCCGGDSSSARMCLGNHDGLIVAMGQR
jgi:hypothetical protein